jgi:alpha-1,2-mannosyltransferase
MRKKTNRLMDLMTLPLIVVCCRVLVVVYILCFAFWYMTADGLKDRSGTPLGADFLNVYAAGILTDHGGPQIAYDWGTHRQTEKDIVGYAAPYFAWHYPPPFLAVAALLALAPYLWALALYLTAGFAAYFAVMRRIAPRARASVWAIAAFPGVITNISNGQNGFITASLFGAGLLALETEPWLGGIAFGLLAYKPQFFVVIPLMLAVGGYGRALLSTLITALASAALSYAAFGAVTWRAFFASTKMTQHYILEQGPTGWQKIQSVFSIARQWGAGIGSAYAWQVVVALFALAISGYLWRIKASLATRAAALCGAIALTTPYLLDYDLMILAIPIGFLARQGIETGFRPYEKTLLVLLWLLPLFARSAGTVHLTLTPPLLIALMLLCLSRDEGQILKNGA